MFRKPKKKPSALRTSGSSSADGAKQAATKKRPRQTRDSSSDSDDDDGANNTSDLLQQIRQERNNNDTKKSKTLLNTSGIIKSKNKSSNSGSAGMMHQYKSSSGHHQLSAQEMATRTAEYHPVNKDNDNNAATTTDAAVAQNAKLSSLSTSTPANPFHAGPLRATTFVRTTARFDYQPDICKDYKETGFCGFGDTCIYLHDRGDSKSGWQMEAEYEEKKKKEEERKGREMERFMNSMMCGEVGTNSVGGNNNDDDDAVKKSAGGAQIDNDDNDPHDKHTNNDGIPYACHICRSAFQSPVITTCGHYFCESCMQRRIREEQLSTCPICQKDTHGVLNYPQKLISKKRRLVGRDGTWEEYLAKK